MLRVVSARAATAQLRPISASRPACRGGLGNETECPGTILPDRRNGLGIISGAHIAVLKNFAPVTDGIGG